MVDEPNATPGVTTPPAGVPDKGQEGAPSDKSQAEAVAMAKELGETRARLEAAQARVDQLEPVIQTIYSDEETLKKVTDVHNKRTGVTPKDEPKKDDKIATTPVVDPTIKDTRNSQIKMIVDKFSIDRGINKLPVGDAKMEPGTQTFINQKIGLELREMLDPMGNKTLAQIMDTVSATKLPEFLDKAYFLATRNEQIAAAKAEGKQQATSESMGIIGSIPSSSIESSEIILSSQEKDIAKKQGVSEEKYLENKKEILKRDGKLF